MADERDISMVLGKLTADERRIWNTIQAERAAGAEAERLAGLERQAAGARESAGNIMRREYEAEGRERSRERSRPGPQERSTATPRVNQPPHTSTRTGYAGGAWGPFSDKPSDPTWHISRIEMDGFIEACERAARRGMPPPYGK